MAKQYNYCLDFIKGIACICVVFMHCEFPGTLGILTQTISRFCVPLFFMVSGYFCFKPELLVKGVSQFNLNKVKHVFRITVNACIFYSLFVLLLSQFKSVNWGISIPRLINWVLFNAPGWAGVAGQYWFLFALLYTYVFYAIIQKLGVVRQSYWLMWILFAVYILLAQGAHLLGIRGIPNMYYRNWLVEGFAFFMLGHWIHHYQDQLRFNNSVLLCIVFLSTLLCVVERGIMGRDFGVNVMTIPQVFCLFLYAVNNPLKHAGVIQIIGLRYSMFVYILHPAVWHTLDLIYQKLALSTNGFALYSRPIIVVLFTLFFSHTIYSIIRYFKTNSIK